MKVQQNVRYRWSSLLLGLMVVLGMGCKTVDCGCPMANGEFDQAIPEATYQEADARQLYSDKTPVSTQNTLH